MKNKKGFTLIELLAVIVILAIIIVIAVFAVTSAINKSKEKAVKADALSLVKAANEYAFQTDTESVQLKNGTFEIDDININLEGKNPDSGYLTFSDYEVTGGCLKYDKYYVLIENADIKSISTTKCDDTTTSEDTSYAFEYTGDVQVFTAPYSGKYQLEVWGAQGGSSDNGSNISAEGGYGGYSTGEITLKQGDILYVVVGNTPATKVGRTGTADVYTGGYNGGGSIGSGSNSYFCAAGGGATHIAFTNTQRGVLSDQDPSDVIIVAGGGGGSTSNNSDFGRVGSSGGGANPLVACSSVRSTQIHFGRANSVNNGYDCGGGGGYFGGSACFGAYGHAVGGQGYLNNLYLTNSKMYCFNCNESTGDQTTIKTNCAFAKTKSNCSKLGNGAAKITLLQKTSTASGSSDAKDFDYTGDIQIFTAPKAGTYKLEVWGAQGGSADYSDLIYFGGYGGYSTGEITLRQGEVLYVVVGNTPAKRIDRVPTVDVYTGGYNGGGSVGTGSNTYINAAGGGATHISKSSGLLADQNQSDVVIVAGGGGGNCIKSNILYGSSGGGYGSSHLAGDYRVGSGTDQTKGAAFGKSNDVKNGYDSGGGGGWYGGSSVNNTAADGGSGHLNTSLLTNAHMVCYNCMVNPSGSDQTTTISACARSAAISDCSKVGNGHARITLVK